MLYRKISVYIKEYLKSGDDKILVLEGARQIGKSFIIREVGSQAYPNFIEVNFVADDEGPQLFKNIHNVNDFYFALSSVAGAQLHEYSDTLVFLDEIQHYPQYFTLLKFLRQDHRYRFIASGSMLGITLRKTTSIPVGSIIRKRMYQLDFEEWLMANNYGEEALKNLRDAYNCTDHEQDQGLSLAKSVILVCKCLIIDMHGCHEGGAERFTLCQRQVHIVDNKASCYSEEDTLDERCAHQRYGNIPHSLRRCAPVNHSRFFQ